MPEKDKILPPQTAYRKRLSDMLDLTYELEGLLHIGVTRSAVPPRLNQLIVDKLNAIVALADEPATPEELGGHAEPVDAPDPTPVSVVAEAIVAEESESESKSNYEAENTLASASSNSAESAMPEEENESNEMPQSNTAETGNEYPSAPDETTPSQEPTEAEDSTSSEETSEDTATQQPEWVDPPTQEKTDSQAAKADDSYEIDEDERPSAPTPQRGRLFSINDRFLYSRELFGGNLKNFDSAIDELITLDSYDEAEEYLISEWNLDPESPSGMKFLSIISKLY